MGPMGWEATTGGQLDADQEYWLSLLRHRPLGILTDLDGTLLPFASTPEAARPTPELQGLVHELADLPGVALAIVSGRPREALDAYFPRPHRAMLVAEHGAWRSKADGWESQLSLDERAINSLLVELRRLLGMNPGAMVERKTWSIAFHYRMVPTYMKGGLLVQIASIVDPWLEAHTDFEKIPGAEVVEIRPSVAHKANAVAWMRDVLGAENRLLLVGDDTTDEDMFAAAGDVDASVIVAPEPGRVTAAHFRLDSAEEVQAFYRGIVALRHERSRSLEVVPARIAPTVTSPSPIYRLLILSNRLPELRSAPASPAARKQNVGGLVSALEPVIADHNGIWLGWSGRTTAGPRPSDLVVDVVDGLPLARVDFPQEWHRHYYNGFCNRALWPLLHSFPGRISLARPDWEAYRSANAKFASLAERLIGREATVWAHDYHLLLLGHFLRSLGHTGRVGFFQHIPFPGPDIFFLLPWAEEILLAMAEYDLLGFHTRSYLDNFLHCMASVPGVRFDGDQLFCAGRHVRTGVFPLGILPDQFQDAGDIEASDEIAGLFNTLGQSRLVLGVDRLDYTKGIPERVDAFGRLLALFPEWRRNVSLVQVSVPSRADVPEYIEQRSRVENIVGRINGEFGDADWVPIRYLYRSYGRVTLSQLYRAADVGYVTPLRDGMNLVAKEYVAAQDPQKPGVLLLSRFAGAAEELHDAILTNPWYPEGVARDLDRALRMPEPERKKRHEKLLAVISKTTALTWAKDFLAALEG